MESTAEDVSLQWRTASLSFLFLRRAGAYLVYRGQLGELRHGDVRDVLTLQLQGVAVAGVVAGHGAVLRLGVRVRVRVRGPDKVTVALRENVVVVSPASLIQNV